MSKLLSPIRDWVLSHRREAVVLLLLIGLSSFLRFYNLRNTIIFLGDEGRDALAVKRIVIDLDPTLLGPTASVGGFYLGPVYYYMIAPFMLAFGMDPVGAAVFVALLGVATVALLYYFVRKLYGIFSASLVSLLYAVAPGIVRFSRSSWNPNPMPFFTLLTLVSFYQAIKTSRWQWLVAVGVCLGIIIQLHYLGLILCGVIGGMTLLLIKPPRWLSAVAAQLVGFLIGSSMFIAFELRHGFLNTKAVIEFITRSGGATGPRSLNLIWLFAETNRFNIEAILGQWSQPISMTVVIALGLLLAFGWWLHYRQGKKVSLGTKIIFFYWILTTIGLSIYKGQLHYHYFELFFPAPFLILAFVLHQISSTKAKVALSLASTLIAGQLIYQAPTWEGGSRLVDQTERVANKVIELANDQPYNFALITNGNSDHAYRFFLEIKNAAPTPLEVSVEEQLIIVCEKWPEDTCAPLGNPLWEVAGFGRAEIVEQFEVYPHTTLYRMIHHPESIDKIGKPGK